MTEILAKLKYHPAVDNPISEKHHYKIAYEKSIRDPDFKIEDYMEECNAAFNGAAYYMWDAPFWIFLGKLLAALEGSVIGIVVVAAIAIVLYLVWLLVR